MLGKTPAGCPARAVPERVSTDSEKQASLLRGRRFRRIRDTAQYISVHAADVNRQQWRSCPSRGLGFHLGRVQLVIQCGRRARPALTCSMVLPSLTVSPFPVTPAYDTTCARITQYLTSVSGGQPWADQARTDRVRTCNAPCPARPAGATSSPTASSSPSAAGAVATGVSPGAESLRDPSRRDDGGGERRGGAFSNSS